MLMVREYHDELPDHGELLHDRFALPYFLETDLEEVLGELTAAGLGFEAALEGELRRDGFRHIATIEYADVQLTLRRGLEFWPLVGDVTLQQGSSRLVDASTARLELVLRAANREGEELLPASSCALSAICCRSAANRTRVGQPASSLCDTEVSVRARACIRCSENSRL